MISIGEAKEEVGLTASAVGRLVVYYSNLEEWVAATQQQLVLAALLLAGLPDGDSKVPTAGPATVLELSRLHM